MLGSQLNPTQPTDCRQRSWHSPGVKLFGAKRPPLCQTLESRVSPLHTVDLGSFTVKNVNNMFEQILKYIQLI